MRSPVRPRHLFVLSAFAIAQPIFDLLSRNAEFLSSHAVGPAELFGLLGLLLLGPPAVLSALASVASRLSSSTGRAVGLACIALLCALIVIAPLLRWAALPEAFAVGLAASTGVGGALAYRRLEAIGRLLDWMLVVPLVFAGLFVLDGDVQKLWRSSDSSSQGIGLERSRNIPIVFVVLDELPLSSIQAADGHIDAGRYPAFARLANDSRWFRGASAISSTTSLALPALLSGRYPSVDLKLPVLADHPENLFSWLAPEYRLNVVESETLLHPSARFGGATEPERARQRTLLADTALVYLHTILPGSLRAALPSVSENWGRFWERDAVDAPGRQTQDALRHATRHERRKHGVEVDIGAFRAFVASIEPLTDGAPRVLHFLHVTYPHNPWRVLPSGRRYSPSHKFGYVDHGWPKEPWWSIDAYRRHLLQLGHADRLLGELLGELQRIELYDRALLIVTADHGASFWPGDTFRAARGNLHPGDLLSVPLFVKLPGQSNASIDDRAVEVIDILPSIAEVLGVDPPWPMDGCSLLRENCAPRLRRRLVHRTASRRGTQARYFELDSVGRGDTLARKVALFGGGDDEEEERGLYLAGQGQALVGRNVGELKVVDTAGGELVLHDRVRAAIDGSDPDLAPARIVGELRSPAEAPILALAFDDVIELVVPAPKDEAGVHRVAAMVPETLLPRVLEGMKLYRVEADRDGPRLLPLTVR